MREPILEMKDVCFRWSTAAGSIPAVQDVDLQMHAQHYLGLVGPNGGGKSTLLKLALGLLTPQHGTVRLLGKPPHASRHQVGFVPQASQLNLQLPTTVMDVVLTGRLHQSFWGMIYGKKHKQAAMAALARVDMCDMAQRPIDALSGGQRQSVLLARALVSEPKLLILDEPATGIDPENFQRLIRLLRELHADGLPLLVVSHDTQFVAEEVNLVGCMNRTLHVHTAEDLTDDIFEQAGHIKIRHLQHENDCPVTQPPSACCHHD